MALTEHQEKVMGEALEILENNNRLVIKGSAGVGKTFMVDTIIQTLLPTLKPSKFIYCSAPTNKAVSVIKNKVTPSSSVLFTTTHSALKLKRVIDFKTGETSFKPGFNPSDPPLKGIQYMFIDEASMLNAELMSYLETYATNNNVKLIFIGDHKQLNPVGEEESTVFLGKPVIDNMTGEVVDYIPYPTVELTEIVRQGEGNPIIDLSRNLPDIAFRENKFSKNEETEELEGVIYSTNITKVIDELAKVNGTDDIKYLAWTNAEVDKINFLVRKKIYGTPGKIEVGETLVFNSPYGDFYTNEEIKVSELDIVEKTQKYVIKNKKGGEFQVAEVDLKLYSISAEGYKDTVTVIHEDSETEVKRIQGELKKRAKFGDISWVDYYSFVELFADLKYNHAITVHKSQGSTYKTAIVNYTNLMYNKNAKERARLIYTGITRSSNLLIIYNS